MTILNSLQADVYRESFHEFFINAFPAVLDPSVKYRDNWHIKYICDRMQETALRIVDGKPHKDLIFNVPVRASKSLIVSVAFNAWVWTVCPTFKLVTASYANGLSLDLSTKTRTLIKSEWYQNLFPEVKIRYDQDTKGYFENTKGGFRFATSTKGTVTGKGGDIIICDDLVNPEEAESPQERKTANEWYDTTLYSRVNDLEVGCRIIIMQRLNEKDITGHLLEKGGYEHVCIPATVETEIKPIELKKNYIDGLFFPTRFTQKVLDDYKNALGERGFTAQFGQSPKVQSGNIINTSKIKYLDKDPKPLQTIQACDTAFKTGETNDNSVCMTWFKFRHPDNPTVDSYYVAHVLKAKYQFPELKKRFEQIAKKYKPYKLLIEDKASGQSLIQEFERDSYLRQILLPVKPDRDKVTRAYSITQMVEDGLVYMPKNAQWLFDLIEELSLFDSGEHDDQVDAFVYALQFFSKKIGDHRVPQLRIL